MRRRRPAALPRLGAAREGGTTRARLGSPRRPTPPARRRRARRRNGAAALGRARARAARVLAARGRRARRVGGAAGCTEQGGRRWARMRKLPHGLAARRTRARAPSRVRRERGARRTRASPPSGRGSACAAARASTRSLLFRDRRRELVTSPGNASTSARRRRGTASRCGDARRLDGGRREAAPRVPRARRERRPSGGAAARGGSPRAA